LSEALEAETKKEEEMFGGLCPMKLEAAYSAEQTLKSLVGSLTSAADSAHFNTPVSFIYKVDYSDIANPYPIYLIVQLLASLGSGLIG